MRTGNLISVIHGSVEISRLDMVAERDPAVIVKAVVSELSHILPLEFLAFPEGLERVVDATLESRVLPEFRLRMRAGMPPFYRCPVVR
jgi:hypothetical protein